jgi:hypothetical protein
MSEDSFYWLYNAPPPHPVPPSPPGPDSIEPPLPHDLWMPTVNPVGSLHSTDDAALGYLNQRDTGAYLRPPETRYYSPSYWSQCRAVQFLRPVLNKLAGHRSSDLRSAYLCLVWDQVSSAGRRASLLVEGRTLWPPGLARLCRPPLHCPPGQAQRNLGRCNAPLRIRRRPGECV